MRCQRPGFIPRVEALEVRLVPKVTLTAFASVQGGPSDSLLLRGNSIKDVLTVIDDGSSIQVLKGNGKAVTNNTGITDPVIFRIKLGGGSDLLNYVVLDNPVLQRRVEVYDGAGRDRTTFNNATEDGTGINLAAGSNFVIDHVGGGNSGDIFFAYFDDVVNSVLDIDFKGKSGDDYVYVAFVGIDADGVDTIDSDSKVTVDINVGAAGPILGNFVTVLLGEFGSSMGQHDDDVGLGFDDGSTLDVKIVGGISRDRVWVYWNFFVIGSFSIDTAPATAINVDVFLDGGKDRFYFLHETQHVIHDQASVTVTARGGKGNDRLIAGEEDFPGSPPIHLEGGGLLDVNLFGDQGNDVVHLVYSEQFEDEETILNIEAGGILRVRLYGGSGNDRVAASLQNSENTVGGTEPGAIYDIELRGNAGRDKMGLHITDPVPVTYVGGAALLDGGDGIDKIDKIFGVLGNVNQVSIV